MSRSFLLGGGASVAEKFYYGGQAVIEGVMMRGKKSMVTAVRRPDGGLAIDTRLLPSIYTGWLRRVPLLRGIIVLIETLVLGMQTLLYSANVSLEEEGEKVSGATAWLMVTLSLALGVVLFFILPLFLTRLLSIDSSLLFNLVDGLIRVVIFVLYLVVMGLMPDIRRVFAYHGAEHKAVNAYEAGIPLEVADVQKYSTAHMRCGTSFLFAVVVTSVIVFALVGLHTVWLMVLSRVLLIPVIAAVSYELIYFGGRHSRNALVRVVLSPGLWLQSLTTREPDDKQLEVALSALSRLIEVDQTEAAVQPAAG